MNSTNKRKNKHLWCVCDSAPAGHWVSTQGQPQVHPNALKDGYAVSSTKKKYTPEGKAAAEAKKGAKRKPAASSSSTGSTLAEADLRIAKANINDLQTQLAEVVSQRDELHLQLHKSMDLGNQELSKAARTANETANAHAKQLRTTKATTGEAIAKMKTMRQHAHGFAELMLPHAVREQAPDHFSCWASFSGLLDDTQIKEAFDKPKSKSYSSAAVDNISEFSDVVQASPFYTVVSAAGSRFCWKECRWRACVRGSYGRCHTDRKIETPLSLFLVSVSLNTNTKDKSLSWRGLSALSFYREGRALHTQHAKHTAGNTHRHRRAWAVS